jgi:hypothetical protein
MRAARRVIAQNTACPPRRALAFVGGDARAPPWTSLQLSRQRPAVSDHHGRLRYDETDRLRASAAVHDHRETPSAIPLKPASTIAEIRTQAQFVPLAAAVLVHREQELVRAIRDCRDRGHRVDRAPRPPVRTNSSCDGIAQSLRTSSAKTWELRSGGHSVPCPIGTNFKFRGARFVPASVGYSIFPTSLYRLVFLPGAFPDTRTVRSGLRAKFRLSV